MAGVHFVVLVISSTLTSVNENILAQVASVFPDKYWELKKLPKSNIKNVGSINTMHSVTLMFPQLVLSSMVLNGQDVI